jgi:hypothetical protein
VKKPLAIWAGLGLLAIGAAGAARAQTVYADPGLSEPALPPYEIMSIVRSTGLAPLTRPMRRGPYYVLVAVDRVGRQMRVVVDAQLGDIVNLRPALAVASYGPEVGRPIGLPAIAAPPPDNTGATPGYYGSHPRGDAALPPVPPRPVPNARAVVPPSAPSPPHVAVAEPAVSPPPPLPRPRPKLALNQAPAAAPAETPAAPPAVKPAVPAAAPPSAAPSAADEAAKQIE